MSLKHLLDQKITTPLQHTWLCKLMHYDYKKGFDHVVVNALSQVQGSTLSTVMVSSLEHALFVNIKAIWVVNKDLWNLITGKKKWYVDVVSM